MKLATLQEGQGSTRPSRLALAYECYPAAMHKYLARVDANAFLRSTLTKSVMKVLMDLVARANYKSPKQKILVRVDRTALSVNVSEKTVQRAFSIFISLGFIVPVPEHDGRNNWGRFSHREFILGDELLELAGFSLDAEMSAGQDDPKIDSISTTRPKMSDGLLINSFKGVFLKEASFLSDESALKENFQEQKTESKKVVNASIEDVIQQPSSTEVKLTIPDDLQDMVTKAGLLKSGVCALMKIAKGQCQRLQDVWILKRDYLIRKNITQGRAFNYLKKLLLSGEDFRFLASKMQENILFSNKNAQDGLVNDSYDEQAARRAQNDAKTHIQARAAQAAKESAEAAKKAPSDVAPREEFKTLEPTDISSFFGDPAPTIDPESRAQRVVKALVGHVARDRQGRKYKFIEDGAYLLVDQVSRFTQKRSTAEYRLMGTQLIELSNRIMSGALELHLKKS